MSLKMRLVRVAALLGLFLAVGFLLPKLGPQAPDSYQGVARPTTTATALQPTGSTAPTSTRVGPPPGFPSMEFPPPENQVTAGDPIPIDTKYKISYTVPGDWQNSSGAIAGWEGDMGSVTYGAIAMYGYDYCPEDRDGARKAITGMTGRNGIDVATAAFEASRQAEIIFRDQPNDDVQIQYSEPTQFQIGGAEAVRYSVRASNLTKKFDCDPTEGTFDVVATQGYSNATIAVFMVKTDQQIEGALPHTEVDQIVSTLRRQN
ncbi:hypothetical protein [Rhodococcus sp. 077-4]|uniref:hypothetical protein n=1 Tax=Rhodococcus sp. 077-4 TaxID=2789271 RepID=UPI0039F4627F